MSRLLWVELRRNFARRLTRLLSVVFLLGAAAVIAIVWLNTDTVSKAELLSRQRQAVLTCATYPSEGSTPTTIVTRNGIEIRGIGPSAATPGKIASCQKQLDKALATGRTKYFPYYDDPRPQLRKLALPPGEGTSILVPIISLLMVGALGAGASMIGAEWKAGTVTTQLLWEPRRTRVFVAKLAATTLAAAVVGIILMIGVSIELLPLFVTKGTTTGTDAAWFGQVAATLARGGFVIGLAAALGASLAMLFRNTAGPILLVFGYIAIAENFLRIWKPHYEVWLVGTNLATVIDGQRQQMVISDGINWSHTVTTSAITLVVYIGVVAAAAALAFRHRDIAATA